MTRYAVMFETVEEDETGGPTYDFIAKDVEAGSPDEAARKAAEMASVGGNFLAFPMRNAEAIPVELERVPRAVIRRETLAA